MCKVFVFEWRLRVSLDKFGLVGMGWLVGGLERILCQLYSLLDLAKLGVLVAWAVYWQGLFKDLSSELVTVMTGQEVNRSCVNKISNF